MGRRFHVNIGEWVIGREDDEFIIAGLGSCIALYLWIPDLRRGGMVHILLPQPRNHQVKRPGRYAVTAVETLWNELRVYVAGDAQRVIAKLVGGALMFPHVDHPTLVNLGLRTAEVVRTRLQSFNIKIAAEDIGGHEGRYIRALNREGLIYIRTRSGEKWL